MNPDLELLQPYPFEKLRQLLAPLRPEPGLTPINLGMGEPQHPPPAFVLEALREQLPLLARYPATRGIAELRDCIAAWLAQRFELSQVDPETQVLPVSGTREALFAIAQAVVRRDRSPLVLCPNPFYQIYEGAALLAGARPAFLDCRRERGFLPDFDAVPADTWQACQLLYICTPGNPSGAVLPLAELGKLVELAQQHDFLIASDECYSEIYRQSPPPGLLQACDAVGVKDFRNCLVFHSLSKRSNLPGLRSGFVAGDAAVISEFLRYRTYQGCAMPLQHQWASIAAWSDEAHVADNRALYTEKFHAVAAILGDRLDLAVPGAGFYLWPETPIDDTDFAAGLYRDQQLTVLPGQYLGRDAGRGNPGARRVRIALVPGLDDCVEAAGRIATYLDGL